MTLSHKNATKNMKRDKCVRTHEAWPPIPLYAAVRILDDPSVAYVLKWWLLSQPKSI